MVERALARGLLTDRRTYRSEGRKSGRATCFTTGAAAALAVAARLIAGTSQSANAGGEVRASLSFRGGKLAGADLPVVQRGPAYSPPLSTGQRGPVSCGPGPSHGLDAITATTTSQRPEFSACWPCQSRCGYRQRITGPAEIAKASPFRQRSTAWRLRRDRHADEAGRRHRS